MCFHAYFRSGKVKYAPQGLEEQKKTREIMLKKVHYITKEKSFSSELSNGQLVSLPLHDERIQKLGLTAVPGGYCLIPFRDIDKG